MTIKKAFKAKNMADEANASNELGINLIYTWDEWSVWATESHNFSTRCVRNRLVASLSTSCNNAVNIQVATSLSLTTCG
jgi:hypothetical protein